MLRRRLGSSFNPRAVRLDDFDYHLPPELIAQQPAVQRSASRLLWLDGRTGRIEDKRFTDLLDLMQADGLLVLNDTRVIKARLFGTKSTGRRLELLVERIVDDRSVLAQVRASKSPRPGSRLRLSGDVEATVVDEQPVEVRSCRAARIDTLNGFVGAGTRRRASDCSVTESVHLTRVACCMPHRVPTTFVLA